MTAEIDTDEEKIIDFSWPNTESVVSGWIPDDTDKATDVTVRIADVSGWIPDDTERFYEGYDNVITVKIVDFSFNMIRVEGGQLYIGATKEQEVYADSNEYPAHQITVETFYISEFLVTQNLFKLVMGCNKSKFIDEFDTLPLQDKGDGNSPKYHNPVETVSLCDAKEFCSRLSNITEMNFSLPTENEWEYAARGGQKSEGHLYAGCSNIDEVAWCKGNLTL